MQIQLNFDLDDLKWSAKNPVCCCAEQGKAQCDCCPGPYVVLCVPNLKIKDRESREEAAPAQKCC